MFTFLHTADWHLGLGLHGRKRHQESAAFLDWLVRLMDEEAVNALLVAGDVFDTAMPDTRAQKLYYNFLCRVSQLPGRQIIITAGNHDSPSFLDAPADILHELGVHVISTGTGEPENEVVTLTHAHGAPAAVVCAVPYLRERDLNAPEAGEDLSSRDSRLLEGLHAHYRKVAQHARSQCAHMNVPLIVMGHLFAAGGQVETGEGVRELHVGSLTRVGSDLFTPDAAYVALGHLHTAQCVNRQEHIRYSGAPMAMRFGETGTKTLCRVNLDGMKAVVSTIPVPEWQRLHSVRADSWEGLATQISALVDEAESVWIEVEYTGCGLIDDLSARLEALTHGSHIEIIRILDRRSIGRKGLNSDETTSNTGEFDDLSDLDENAVFERRMEADQIPPEQRPELRRLHTEILLSARNETGEAHAHS